MTDYTKYINSLRKCAKEHENDNTLTGHIIVSDLCHDTANLLESLEQDTSDTLISIQTVKDKMIKYGFNAPDMTVTEFVEDLPSVTSQPKTGHWIDTGSGQECSECHEIQHGYDNFRFYCAKCGSKNVIESEVEFYVTREDW